MAYQGDYAMSPGMTGMEYSPQQQQQPMPAGMPGAYGFDTSQYAHSGFGMEYETQPPQPQIRDVAGNPLDQSKALEISRLRAMVDDMGAVVDTAKRKLDDAHNASLAAEAAATGGTPGGPGPLGMMQGGDEGMMGVTGDAMAEGPMFRTLAIDPQALPISEGTLRVKQQRTILTMGRRWPAVPVRIDEAGMLLVYAQQRSEAPSTSMKLSARTVVEVRDGSAHRAAEAAFPFLVANEEQEQQLLLSADSDETRSMWVAAIEAVIGADAEVQTYNSQVQEQMLQQQQQQQQQFGGFGMMGVGDPAAAAAAGGAEGKTEEEAEAERQREQIEEILAMRHVAYGPGITGGARGEQTEFVVEMHDEAGQLDDENFDPNVITAILDSEALELQLELTIEDMGGGRGVCYYTPPQAGQYELAIQVRGKHIQGSPFEIDVDAAPTAPGKCLVEGDGAVTARVGAQNTFTIVAFDQFGEQRVEGGDRWSVDVVGPATEPVVVDNDDGTYSVNYEVDLDHADIRKGGRRPPVLEFHVYLLDPRFERLSQAGNPYRRPLKNMPVAPAIILDTPGGGHLTAEELASLAPSSFTPAGAAASSSAASSRFATASTPLGPTPQSAAAAAAAASASQHHQTPASASSIDAPSTTSQGGDATARLHARVAEAEAGAEAARRELAQALTDKAQAEAQAEEDRTARAEAEAEAQALRARLEESERRAETAEAQAAEQAGSSEQAQGILAQLTEQSAKLEAFARELNERQRQLQERERALRAEEEALAAGDRAAAAAVGRSAAGHTDGTTEGRPSTVGSMDASLLEQAQLAAAAGDTTISSLAADNAGAAGPVAGGGPASLASGPAMSLDTAAMMHSAYTGAGQEQQQPQQQQQFSGDADARGPGVDLSDGAPAELFAEDAVAIIEAHRPVLFDVFTHYSRGSGRITASQFVRLMKDYDIISTFTSSGETKKVFAEAADANGEVPGEDGKLRLGFAGFVEALGRMALVTLSKPTFSGLYPTAHEKLGVMLDVWSLGSADRLAEVKEATKERKRRKKRAGGV